MNVEFLKKVKKLAECGVGGEKTNAEELLKKLIKKYNISPGELEADTERRWYKIPFRGQHEKTIVSQCAFKVFGGVEEEWEKLKGYYLRGKMYIYCTKLEYAEIAALCEFYRACFNRDLKIFTDAFVQKNRLFPERPPPEKKRTKEEEEEVRRIFEMMIGMQEHEIYKQIEQKAR
ncbi:MAG: hypothetical protein LBP62_03270 [Clostridiales bacterium]|jgi:hypothetical protein|nr:hypothetical protein [Clostridiales bacterium]